MSHLSDHKDELLKRTQRIAGQVQAIQRSLEPRPIAKASCTWWPPRGASTACSTEILGPMPVNTWRTWPDAGCTQQRPGGAGQRHPPLFEVKIMDSLPSPPGRHGHSFRPPHDENAKRTRWVVLLTLAMMVGEIVAGYLTGSMALLADGFHMATHAGALGIAAVAMPTAKRNADNRAFSFGTGKVGELAGFASALMLAMVSLAIGVESAIRLVQPTDVAFGEATLIAVVGLGVNLVSALLLGGGHAGHVHAEHHHPGMPATRMGMINNLRSAYVP